MISGLNRYRRCPAIEWRNQRPNGQTWTNLQQLLILGQTQSSTKMYKDYGPFFALLVMFLSGSGCAHTRSAEAPFAVIEFERPENNGSVNIFPCTLVLSDGQRLTLSGGDRAAVSVPTGNFRIRAFSLDPYHPHSDPAAWSSPRMRFHAGRGDRLRFVVEPTALDSTYIGGWTIRPAK